MAERDRDGMMKVRVFTLGYAPTVFHVSAGLRQRGLVLFALHEDGRGPVRHVRRRRDSRWLAGEGGKTVVVLRTVAR